MVTTWHLFYLCNYIVVQHVQKYVSMYFKSLLFTKEMLLLKNCTIAILTYNFQKHEFIGKWLHIVAFIDTPNFHISITTKCSLWSHTSTIHILLLCQCYSICMSTTHYYQWTPSQNSVPNLSLLHILKNASFTSN